jgi:hypothetical protein
MTQEGTSLAGKCVDSRLGCIREEDVASKLGFFLALGIAITTAACSASGSMSPTGPSGARGAQIAGRVTGVNMSSTASISGLSASPLTQTTSSTAPLKVSVNGTNIETNVDGTGHFTLNGVPSGTIVLNFTGRGVNASVTLRGVSTGDQIEIEVRLEGSGARVESENRHRREGDGEDDDEDDDENEEVRTLPDSTIKVEGAALSLSGTCPTLTFGLASKIVKTNSSTIFDDIRCSSITNMTRLEVLGRPQGDGTILATKVERED